MKYILTHVTFRMVWRVNLLVFLTADRQMYYLDMPIDEALPVIESETDVGKNKVVKTQGGKKVFT
jgi:hypothetical protein